MLQNPDHKIIKAAAWEMLQTLNHCPDGKQKVFNEMLPIAEFRNGLYTPNNHRPNAVYIELPTASVPYISKFPLTEAGFSKALGTLRDARRKQAPTISGDQPIRFERHPLLPKPEFSDAARAKAREILKKRGIIG